MFQRFTLVLILVYMTIIPPSIFAKNVGNKLPQRTEVFSRESDSLANVYKWLGNNHGVARGGAWPSRDLKVGTPFQLSNKSTQRTDVGFRVLSPYSASIQ